MAQASRSLATAKLRASHPNRFFLPDRAIDLAQRGSGRTGPRGLTTS